MEKESEMPENRKKYFENQKFKTLFENLKQQILKIYLLVTLLVCNESSRAESIFTNKNILVLIFPSKRHQLVFCRNLKLAILLFDFDPFSNWHLFP